jgi:hypothetical protein
MIPDTRIAIIGKTLAVATIPKAPSALRESFPSPRPAVIMIGTVIGPVAMPATSQAIEQKSSGEKIVRISARQ